MPTPYQLAQQFRAALIRRDAEALREITAAYERVITSIQLSVSALGAQAQRARAAGQTVSAAWLFREQRLQLLLSQAEQQLAFFTAQLSTRLTNDQQAAVSVAQVHTQQMLRAAGAEVSFARLPEAAIETLIGFSGDGAPLTKLLSKIPSDASARIRETLLTSLAVGQNPRQTARQISDALQGNKARALTIARTETLRAYREASRQTAKAAGVERWEWIASQSRRTCLACLAMDGQIFSIEKPQPAHPNCRCSALWLPPGVAPRARVTGAQWFEQQPDEVRAAMMSKLAFEAYSSGDVSLQDFVGIKRSRVWGETRSERSFKDASKFAKRRVLWSQTETAISADVTKLGKFQSLADATQWAQQQYPQIKWDFTGADLDAINPTLAQFHQLAQAYPDVANRLEYFGTYKGANSPRKYLWPVGDFAHATRDGKWVGLNPRDYGDAGKLLATLTELEEIGHFAPGSAAIEYLLTHEFGHLIENWLRSLTSKAVLDVVSADGTGLVADTLLLWKQKHKATAQLSVYSQKNEQEGWAEGFAAQYHTPKAQWTAYVKAQRQLLKALDTKLHKEVFQWYSDISDLAAREKARDLINTLRKRLGL